MRTGQRDSVVGVRERVIPSGNFALPATWVRGIKLRLFAFSSVAASHDSFATGLRSGRPIFVLPLLRENRTPGCPIQRVLENDFVVVTGTGTARDFIRLLTVELRWKDKEKTGLPGLPIKGLVKIAK